MAQASGTPRKPRIREVAGAPEGAPITRVMLKADADSRRN